MGAKQPPDVKPPYVGPPNFEALGAKPPVAPAEAQAEAGDARIP